MNVQNVVGMIRVKNEERWLWEVLGSLCRICRNVVILDDHSTDKTLGVIGQAELWNHGISCIMSPFWGLDEQRDKNYLLGKVLEDRKRPLPDWILHVDGDEILSSSSAGWLQKNLDFVPKDVQALAFKIDYMWDSPDQYRTDGRYGDFWRGSMFRVVGLEKGFRSTGHGKGANLHCTNIPAGIEKAMKAPVRVKHYGYMDREDRLRKWEYYKGIDPGNRLEDEYRHIVIGDVPELPKESVTRWAGPLKLEEWKEGMETKVGGEVEGTEWKDEGYGERVRRVVEL